MTRTAAYIRGILNAVRAQTARKCLTEQAVGYIMLGRLSKTRACSRDAQRSATSTPREMLNALRAASRLHVSNNARFQYPARHRASLQGRGALPCPDPARPGAGE